MDSKDLFNNNNNETSKECPISPLFECFPECLVDVFADVQGVIPPWLSGSLVRVGPGKFKYGEQEVKHWFDGAGILHKFSVAEGRVTFQSKFIESEAYKNNTAQQRITVAEFGTSITP
ncbi:BCO2 [Bugula neritina]|uniref:BCO2 n=1 Tax=Bugula neritina TaxID=10212 RepID=A0A7J7KBG7_BUGNE|nr:BCO2 [Bugula neritina]